MQSVASEPSQPPRRPACTLCKARKIKCDRDSPCMNCTKSGAECVQRTNAKTRNRKKPAAELQQKLALCEQLIQQLSNTKRPEGAINLPDSGHEQEGGENKPLDAALGKLVIDGGSFRFTDNALWAAIFDELQSMKRLAEDVDSPPSVQDRSFHSPAIGGTVDILSTQNVFLGGIRSLHPSPSHIMTLWQIFLDRINPMTKLVHVPSIQCYLSQATMELPCLSPDLEALFFSIYGSAVGSMREEECAVLIGEPKKELLGRFSSALQTALHRARFLEAPTLTLLQALALHLTSIPGRQSAHANWVLSGVCIRSAQRLGMHRDGQALGLPPLETELRRRVWWHVVLLDFRFALASGFTPTPLAGACDTRMPTNIDDEDLDIATTSHPENRHGPTDMIICLITSGLAKSLVKRSNIGEAILAMETNAMSGSSSQPQGSDMTKFVADVEDCLGSIVKDYCDPAAGPLHVAAFQIKSAMTQKIWMMARGPRRGLAETSSHKERANNLFTLSVEAAEQFANLLRVMGESNFLWFVLQYFEQDLFTYMLGQLCHRTTGEIVDRAWEVLPIIFAHHGDLIDRTTEFCFTIETFLFRAWRARQEDILLRLGYLPETPGFVQKVEQNLRNRGQSTNPPYTTAVGDRSSRLPEFDAAFWNMMGWRLAPEQSFGEPGVEDSANWHH